MRESKTNISLIIIIGLCFISFSCGIIEDTIARFIDYQECNKYYEYTPNCLEYFYDHPNLEQEKIKFILVYSIMLEIVNEVKGINSDNISILTEDHYPELRDCIFHLILNDVNIFDLIKDKIMDYLKNNDRSIQSQIEENMALIVKRCMDLRGGLQSIFTSFSRYFSENYDEDPDYNKIAIDLTLAIFKK